MRSLSQREDARAGCAQSVGEALEKALLPSSSSGFASPRCELFFFQLPLQLPAVRRPEEDGRSAGEKRLVKEGLSNDVVCSSLQDLPSGRFGRLEVRRSGKASLKLCAADGLEGVELRVSPGCSLRSDQQCGVLLNNELIFLGERLACEKRKRISREEPLFETPSAPCRVGCPSLLPGNCAQRLVAAPVLKRG